jgi:hypothetical protein
MEEDLNHETLKDKATVQSVQSVLVLIFAWQGYLTTYPLWLLTLDLSPTKSFRIINLILLDFQRVAREQQFELEIVTSSRCRQCARLHGLAWDQKNDCLFNWLGNSR